MTSFTSEGEALAEPKTKFRQVSKWAGRDFKLVASGLVPEDC